MKLNLQPISNLILCLGSEAVRNFFELKELSCDLYSATLDFVSISLKNKEAISWSEFSDERFNANGFDDFLRWNKVREAVLCGEILQAKEAVLHPIRLVFCK